MVKNNIAKNKTDYLIIGNSAAGLSAAENIRKIDKKGRIELFCNESFPNYSKPLITYYLSGKLSLENVFFKKEEFYRQNNIILNLNTAITSFNAASQRAFTDKGKVIEYGSLLIACGGRPVIPQIKIIDDNNKVSTLGGKISGIEGIFTLTNLDDALTLKKYIEGNKIGTASIMGGGLIGLKAAEAFLEMNIQINIIELSEKILSASFDEKASEIISEEIRKTGSTIVTGSTIDSIYTSNGRIKKYRLSNGEVLPCELLVVAVGVLPGTDLVKNEEIAIDGGIIVDSGMKTNLKNVYAAGDVIKSFDQLAGIQKNIAIWPLAVKQGAVAGKNMAGGNAEYSGGFFMNSVEILGIPVISLGLSSLEENLSDDIQVLRTYRPEKKIYRKIVIRNNRVIGGIFIGAVERAGIYAGLISSEIDISEIRENIAKEDFGILQLPADYRKHLVVGEGIEV